MDDLKIISHFSQAEWPIVNKLRAIASSAEIEFAHCPTKVSLFDYLDGLSAWDRTLIVTDDSLLDLVAEVEDRYQDLSLETLLFLDSDSINSVQSLDSLKTIKYILGSKRSTSLGRDLSIFLKKVKNQDFMELAKYLSYGATIRESLVFDPESKRSSIAELRNYIAGLGSETYQHSFLEYSQRMARVCDELIINSIFGPNTENQGGLPTEDFHLPPEAALSLSWGFDGENFGFSLVDKRSSFSREELMKSAQYDYKASDADLPLNSIRMTFGSIHQFVVNVRSGAGAEFVCLVKLEARIRDFEETKNSIFYFSQERS